MLVLIRGAGDLASGIALRLFHAGLSVVMTEIARPTTIRRTVAFSQAVGAGKDAGGGRDCPAVPGGGRGRGAGSRRNPGAGGS